MAPLPSLEPGLNAPEERPHALPVAPRERLSAVDTLRGVALLGILIMNIPFFALSSFGFFNPNISGGFEGIDRAAWLVSHLFFDQKMMAIFSMLFGAGMVLLTERTGARGASPAAIYYRRIAWLLVIGMLHAYGLWTGDILVSYALSGLIIYPLRRLSVPALITTGAIVAMIAVPIWVAMGLGMGWAREHEPDMFAQMTEGFVPTPEKLEKERLAMTGGYGAYAAHTAENSALMQLIFFPTWALWRCTGLMLIGMGLMKAGVFSGARSTRFYGILATVGFTVGLAIVGTGAAQLIETKFEVVQMFTVNWHLNYVGSIGVALGWVGLTNLVLKFGVAQWLTARLAAVGRMALTNYLSQTIICTTLFCGWGFGLWEKLGRAELLGVVLMIWIAQLLVSPWWLSRFRFGPAEWVWRSLTYWERQPMRLAAGPAPASPGAA